MNAKFRNMRKAKANKLIDIYQSCHPFFPYVLATDISNSKIETDQQQGCAISSHRNSYTLSNTV